MKTPYEKGYIKGWKDASKGFDASASIHEQRQEGYINGRDDFEQGKEPEVIE